MDSHTNFDANAFSRNAGLNIFGIGAGLATAVQTAVANAQALADVEATAMTVQQWHATVQGLVVRFVAMLRQNAELARTVAQLTAKNRELELEVRALLDAI